MTPNWIARLFARCRWSPVPRKHKAQRRASFRPAVEPLEDRQMLTTFTVTSLVDNGTGSLTSGDLRYVINQANLLNTGTAGSPDLITFSGVTLDTVNHANNTINVGTGTAGAIALPALTDIAVIDAMTAVNYNPAAGAIVVVNGSNLGTPVNGLTISGGGSTVEGLEVINFSDPGQVSGFGNGIRLDTKGSDTVQADFIGIDIRTTSTGTAAPNGSDGVLISATSSNLIGGLAASDRNVISGNNASGVDIEGSTAATNTIEGNYLGTDAAGTGAVGNVQGVYINNASSNIVGGTTSGARNVISGNSQSNVVITADAGKTASGNLVEGNYLGTDATGNTALLTSSQTFEGVLLQGDSANHGVSGNTIGGASSGAGNVISGNQNGIVIFQADTNTVAGNFIGTNSTGTGLPVGSTHGNTIDGVRIDTASGNIIGGAVAAARNIISGNNGSGVDILGPAATNTIEGNYIGTTAAGTAALANAQGVYISNASSNTVGGTTSGARNVISGNSQSNVVITADTGNTASGNLVEGNYIGTDATGNTAVLTTNQTFEGVLLQGGSDHGVTANTIGGPTAGARNVISGNLNGVVIFQADTNTVSGNFIGTDTTGLLAVPNSGDGIQLDLANTNTVSGTANAPQVISGNRGRGITITGDSSTFVTVTPGPTATTLTVASTTPIAAPSGTLNILDPTGTTVVASFTFTSTTATSFVGPSQNTAGIVAGDRVVPGAGTDAPANGNLVQGNLIGTDANASSTDSSLGNGLEGIYITNGANANPIGGSGAGQGNTIAFNQRAGVLVGIDTSDPVFAQTTATIAGGTLPLGAPGTGTLAVASTNGFAASGTLAIQTTTGQGLLTYSGLSGNTFTGVTGGTGTFLAGATVAQASPDNNDVSGGSGNPILGNSLSHTGGILLTDSGNSSAGLTQVAPIITNVSPATVLGGSNSTITYTLANMSVGVSYRVEFFGNDSNNPEGKTFLGFMSVSSATGSGTFTFTAVGVSDPQFITATATNTTSNNTSQFSNPAPEFSDNFLTSGPAATTVSAASNGTVLPLANGTINVASTNGFQPAGTIAVLFNTDNTGSGANVNGFRIITYTGETATSFTGCNGGGTGTLATGMTVVQSTTVTAATAVPPTGGVLAVASTAGFPISNGQLAVADNFGMELFNYTGVSGNTFTGVTGGQYGTTISAGALVLGNLSPNWVVPTNVFSYPGVAVPSGNTTSFAGQVMDLVTNPTAIISTQLGVMNEDVTGLTLGDVAVSADINASAPVALQPIPGNIPGVLNTVGLAARLQPVGAVDANGHNISGDRYILLMENYVSTLVNYTFVSILRLSDLTYTGSDPYSQGNNFGWTQIAQSLVTVSSSGHLEFDVVNTTATINQSGTTTLGSATVAGLTTSQLAVGMTVSGTGILAGTTITAINSPSQITLSNVATASGTNPLTFTGNAVDLTGLFNGVEVVHGVDASGAFGPVNGHLNTTRGPITNPGAVGFFGDGISMLIGNFAVRKLVATTDAPVPFTASFNNNNNNNTPTELGGPFQTMLQNGGFQLQADLAASLSAPAYQFSAASLYGLTALNPTLQADVDVTNPLALGAGLFARAQGVPGNFYGALLTSTGVAEIVLFHADTNPANDTLTILGSAPVGVTKGTLRFAVTGGANPILTLSLNGSVVVTVTGLSGTNLIAGAGQEGILAWGAGARIDNFILTGS